MQTMALCPRCEHEGVVYIPGETVQSADGCLECVSPTCVVPGVWSYWAAMTPCEEVDEVIAQGCGPGTPDCSAIGPNSNLTGCDLSGQDLSGADLSGTNLGLANLSGADLSGADLSGTVLNDADLSGANLSGANLTGAMLGVVDLSDANLSGAILDHVWLADSDLTGANLSDADLTEVRWVNITCPDGTNSDNNGGTCVGHL